MGYPLAEPPYANYESCKAGYVADRATERASPKPEYDTHIPIPPLNRKRSDACDVLINMPVGASKLYAASVERVSTLRKQAMARAKGHQYTTRKVTEDGVHGVRIWRTA